MLCMIFLEYSVKEVSQTAPPKKVDVHICMHSISIRLPEFQALLKIIE